MLYLYSSFWVFIFDDVILQTQASWFLFLIRSFLNIYRMDWHAPYNGYAVVFIAHHSLWLVLIALVDHYDDDRVHKKRYGNNF